MKHKGIEVYERDIDAGHGVQSVVVFDGIIVKQTIESKSNGSYTGDGNPELINKKIDDVKRLYHLYKVYLSENTLEMIYQSI